MVNVFVVAAWFGCWILGGGDILAEAMLKRAGGAAASLNDDPCVDAADYFISLPASEF
ncbi:hypothetical protein VFPPC_16262 [Pochonia chlamydosporia 170]|uniref:Uncharacterized protein n=1 Tax=Pochonia chlamydosporia 170 TaxID=1380566 RepID=A0A179FHV8_METCM|nr:hypothetical protein VFPPC_16262 [Pochonia chlamydosporia 170]OAQ64821.1 hypothetical protein VFPPC_16262 [Pochonia chlamydosporia 170]